MIAEQPRQLDLFSYLDSLEQESLKPGSSILYNDRYGLISRFITAHGIQSAVVHLEGRDRLEREETLIVPVARLRPASTTPEGK